VDRDDLAQLITEGIPFVSIGRREDAGGPVPYVGVGYRTAVRTLVGQAVALGHRTLAYVGAGEGAESSSDRMRGFRDAVDELGVLGVHLVKGTLDDLRAIGATAVLTEENADGAALVLEARARGFEVPGDLSVLTLGAATRQAPPDVGLTGFHIPRRAMGRRAVQLLADLLQNGTTPQELLPCEPVEGSTLSAPRD
jgi:DNA-binding LacI/PurR family transcriptional regulator